MFGPIRNLVVAALTLLMPTVEAGAADAVLIENVRIFNGVDAKLVRGNVLVEGRLIKRVSRQAIDPPEGAVVIDGADRILSPGLIDIHTHLMFQYPRDQLNYDTSVVGAYAAEAARFYLESGFTTVRDTAGVHPDFAKAIDAGFIFGPRIYPAGPGITQTAGHGDFRQPVERHPTLQAPRSSPYLPHKMAVIADGVEQVLMAVRENLRLGATQIKINGGGGVLSEYDPIHTLQFSPEEIRAAVQAANDWGTYVLAHAYTPEAIRRLVENGVRSIEHGLLIDDATARLCAENDVVISTQIVLYRTLQGLPNLTDDQRAKLKLVLDGQENLVRLIKKYDITTGFGTDFVFGDYRRLASEFTARTAYWTPAEVLRQATSENGRIIRMSGKLNRHGNFGEIREGWVADILLINGEPLEDISILENPDEALALIMKDGRIVRNRT